MKETLIILTPGFPADETDTTCLPPQQVFVHALQQLHPETEIIVVSFQYPYQKKEYDWHGVKVISFGGKNKGGLSRRLLWNKVHQKLQEIHQQKKIKAILSFWYGECGYVGKKFAGKNQLRHFSWILGQDAKKDNRFVKRLRPRADELIALSDFIQDEFEKNHGVRPQWVVPPGIDTNMFAEYKDRKDIDVLAAGSLIPLKQYTIFMEVIAALKKENPFIHAVLAGNGPEKKKLDQLIIQYELERNVKLAGELPHAEVLALMQKAKVFLHPSSYEGFGVVCMEALYTGAAVISFCKPMKEEIMNWYVVNNTSSMIDITKRLLHNKQDPKSVLFNSIENSVEKIWNLLK
jgi:glycosyltransferase involved in cell wall biosynthesis